MTFFAHPTAVVDEGAIVGDGTKIWHFAHVCAGAVIGTGCSLGQNVYVGPGVRIGRNVKIQNNVSVYEGVEIEDDVFLGPSCVFTNVKNPRADRRGTFDRTIVRTGATIGANATIVCGSTIGRHAFIAAGAVVTAGDVPDHALMKGVPARLAGFVDREGRSLEAPSNHVVPFFDLRAQYASIRNEIDAAIARVLESQLFILGPEVEAFEKEIAAVVGAKHAIGMSSGTDALLAALMAAGVGPGDEVVTSPFSFVATAAVIARLGARARFVDLAPGSFLMDRSRIDAAVGPKTKAVVPVHLFGETLALRSSVPVIEDAAQAIGTQRAGVMTAYSFFPTKNLGAFGDGGLVATDDDALADRLRALRSQGQRARNDSTAIGGNFRLDAIQAAVLRAKLPHLDAWTAARQRHAAGYRRTLAGLPLALPAHSPEHVYNQFVVRTPRRDELRTFLAERGIGSEVYYPKPLHLQAAFSEWGYRPGDLPESERAAAEALALPVYPELTDDARHAVCSAIRDFFDAHAREGPIPR
jgi:dTDP-4-amino-4,6-dideoxygalactose transaminase/acetyltransferase-like isoleucine patch superfamily enzyme